MIRPWAPAVLALATALAPAARAAEEADKPKRPKELAGLSYRLVGPPAGGRVSRVAGVPGDPLTYYAATASGGVWKSRTAASAGSRSSTTSPMSSIGSIAVAPSDPNVVYVGSGEANIRGNVGARATASTSPPTPARPGSTSGSRTGQIGTMVVHPTNPDVAFAAVLGKRLRPEPRARRLPHARRRQDLGAGALQGRGHRRLRRGARPAQPAHRLRRPLAGAAPAVGADERRARQRPLRLARRRRHVEAAQGQGPARGDLGQGRRRGRALRPAARLRARSRPRRAGSSAPTTAARRWTLASGHRALRQRAWYYSTLTVDPQNPDVVWFPQVPLLQDDRRRQDDHERRRASTTATTTTCGSTRRTRGG